MITPGPCPSWYRSWCVAAGQLPLNATLPQPCPSSFSGGVAPTGSVACPCPERRPGTAARPAWPIDRSGPACDRARTAAQQRGDRPRWRRGRARQLRDTSGVGRQSGVEFGGNRVKVAQQGVGVRAAIRPPKRLRDARTASRNVRDRPRSASSGAVASSAVGRSSRAETRLDPTAQPPAAWSSDAVRRRSGTSERANHATSPSAAARSACHVRRLRARRSSGTATATATSTAASSHHNPAVVSLVSAVGPAADGDEVSGDAGAAAADPVMAGSGTSVAVMACVGGAGRVTERVGRAAVGPDRACRGIPRGWQQGDVARHYQR